MRDKLLFLLKYYLFWVVFSWVAKVVFLIYQYKETATLTGYDYVMIFAKGFRMDLSFGGYVILLSCVLMAIGVFLSAKILKRIFSCLTLLLLVMSSLIIVGDLELFKNWGYHMDATPLFYLKTPGGNGFNSDRVNRIAFITLCCYGGCLLYVLPSLGGQDLLLG